MTEKIRRLNELKERVATIYQQPSDTATYMLAEYLMCLIDEITGEADKERT